MTDWLKKRLPPAKAKTPMWVELTESVQEFWDTHYEPLIDSVERARSVFTADELDVDRRLEERGIKFEVALPFAIGSKAVYYSMRAYELHSKDNEGLLSSILGRDFGGFSIKWLPLFAPKNEPYGSKFITEFDITWFNYSSSDLWSTSRGKVLYDITNALSVGVSRLEMKEAILRKVYELKPVHIVFDGIYFVSYFTLIIQPCTLSQTSYSYSTNQIPVDFFPAAYFDDTQLDDYRLDLPPVSCIYRGYSITTVPMTGMCYTDWRLDMGWVVNGVQRTISGIEGDVVSTLHNLGTDSKAVIQTAIEHVEIVQASRSVSVIGPTNIEMFTVRYFDDARLDDCRLDSNMVSIVNASQSVFSVQAWPQNQWSLDTGWIINGEQRTIACVETDLVQRLSVLGCDSSTVLPNLSVIPTVTTAASVESLFFDAIPADFLPLDMRFS